MFRPPRQHQQPPNDEVCSSVSIDSSRTTALPPRGSKCNIELSGSWRIHGHRQRMPRAENVRRRVRCHRASRGADIGHRCSYPLPRQIRRGERRLARVQVGQSSSCPPPRRRAPSTGAADRRWRRPRPRPGSRSRPLAAAAGRRAVRAQVQFRVQPLRGEQVLGRAAQRASDPAGHIADDHDHRRDGDEDRDERQQRRTSLGGSAGVRPACSWTDGSTVLREGAEVAAMPAPVTFHSWRR